ncbi:MAG TPA: DUF1653 domain-containing protein [Candidatus Saccharimonadales bacterium]|nr:DUF1653 domain-containing protein [Candidatus Saccharimonadales bacterium]
MGELKAGVYKHYSGLLVLAIGVARHSETEEKLVAYVPLGVKEKPRITVRPYDMFFEAVDIDGSQKPRFEYIGEEVGGGLASQYDDLSGYAGEDRPNVNH